MGLGVESDDGVVVVYTSANRGNSPAWPYVTVWTVHPVVVVAAVLAAMMSVSRRVRKENDMRPRQVRV